MRRSRKSFYAITLRNSPTWPVGANTRANIQNVLGKDGYPADPHVERGESFALLTGRMGHEMDAQFPEITSSLSSVATTCAVAGHRPFPDHHQTRKFTTAVLISQRHRAFRLSIARRNLQFSHRLSGDHVGRRNQRTGYGATRPL